MKNLDITSYAFKSVKIAAKQFKKELPDLSHSKRLDLASKRILGKRHFHEVRKLHETYLKKIALPNHDMGANHVHTCPYCHMHFCHDLDEDIKQHEEHHKEWEKAEFHLQYSPLNYRSREKLKKEAYKKLGDTGEEVKIMSGALDMITAHFDRSLENAIFDRSWGEHPSFEQYAALYDSDGIIPKEIMNKLNTKFGVSVQKMPKGRSYWVSEETKT